LTFFTLNIINNRLSGSVQPSDFSFHEDSYAIKGKTMRVRVDEELCIGCEACVEICPEVFEMQSDVAVAKIEDDIPDDLEDTCREAAESCPVEAILVED